MEKTPFLGAENELQKIYSNLGVMVPVGDLSQGKAPAIQPLPSTSTQTTVTAQFNVMSGGDITALSYKVNDGEAVSLTPAKGVVTITIEDLEYNSGPYEIELTATNATGSTVTSSTVALQHYTNWATPDEVLLGNKYIGEDGQEYTGEYECPTCPEPVLETVPVTPTTSAQTITPSIGYDGIGQVNVSAVTSSIDANITAGNIKNGVTILGVTGTMTGGPTDGGAVITSAIFDGDFGTSKFTFGSLPTGMDLDNHRYLFVVMSRCYNWTGGEPEFEEVIAPISQIDAINYTDTFNSQYDSSTDTLTIGYCEPSFHNEITGEDDTEVDADLYIYEDTLEYNGLKWVIPCTIADAIIPEQNVGE